MRLHPSLGVTFLLLLAGCGPKSQEESPGAAARYLDNVAANEPTADRAAAAKDLDRISPSSGTPDESVGQAPIFSREPVAPRKP
jgi:hypothetical protein